MNIRNESPETFSLEHNQTYPDYETFDISETYSKEDANEEASDVNSCKDIPKIYL